MLGYRVIRQSGFTLAEVLITLAIVGIVAALTIPNMIANYQKEQTVVQLKKAYTVLSTAFNAAENEHGPISSWPETFYTTSHLGVCAGLGHDDCQLAFFNKYLADQFNHYEYKKRPDNIYNSGNSFKGLNGISNLNAGGKSYKWFYLDDGTCFFLIPNLNYHWSYIFYDINGDKAPNIVGKDIFTFNFGSIVKFKFGFDGKSWSTPANDQTRTSILNERCSKTNGGYYGGNGCGWVIQYDGWQIKNDYPW